MDIDIDCIGPNNANACICSNALKSFDQVFSNLCNFPVDFDVAYAFRIAPSAPPGGVTRREPTHPRAKSGPKSLRRWAYVSRLLMRNSNSNPLLSISPTSLVPKFSNYAAALSFPTKNTLQALSRLHARFLPTLEPLNRHQHKDDSIAPRPVQQTQLISRHQLDRGSTWKTSS
jgi:hypothetical protein